MNNHFCSLGSKLASGIPDTAFQPEHFLNRTDSNFYFRPVSEGYIHSLAPVPGKPISANRGLNPSNP